MPIFVVFGLTRLENELNSTVSEAAITTRQPFEFQKSKSNHFFYFYLHIQLQL